MKTSNKLLFTATILVCISLVFYDLNMQASFLKGDYKNPYKDFISLNFKNFKTIDLRSETVANILVTQGPFSVRISPDGDSFVKVSQNADTLHIAAAFVNDWFETRSPVVLVISCPNLARLITDSRYMAGDRVVIDSAAGEDFKWRTTTVSGFKQDSLYISAQHGCTLMLKNNDIKSLNATIGMGNGCRSNLTILGDNHFAAANLNILNKSQLRLYKANITRLNYKLADSARLIVYGGADSILKK